MGTNAATGRGGFTIVELMVVIAIIAVLAAIVLTVGAGVSRSARERLTRDTIRVLDNALDTYVSESGGEGPPRLVEVPHPIAANAGSGETVLVPFVDGVDATGMSAGSDRDKHTINTVGLFVQAVEQLGVGSSLDDLPQGSVGQLDPDEPTGTGMNRQPLLTTVLDGWGNPIRAVHPAFDGVLTEGTLGATYAPTNIDRLPLVETQPQPNLGLPDGVLTAAGRPVSLITHARRALFTDEIRAANAGRPIDDPPVGVVDPFLRKPEPGDSDGGISPNGRVYFYSAGANGDPSDIESNIYTTEPRRPQID